MCQLPGTKNYNETLYKERDDAVAENARLTKDVERMGAQLMLVVQGDLD